MGVMDYYYEGTRLSNQKDYDAAIEVFNTALDKYPDDYSILDRRAVTYHEKGDTEKALADYTRMIAVDPKNPDGWNGRGNLYHELGEYDKAIADYTECIPLSPNGYGTYWSNRGISYYEKGDLDAALADLNKSIERWSEPDYADYALLYRGLVWRKKGDLGKALADFILSAGYHPGDGDASYQAGYVWFLREEYDTAIRFFSTAIATKGDVADYWLARGVCYWSKCREDKISFWDEDGEIMRLAIDDFTKAIEYAPNMAEAYFDRGVVHCAIARESNTLIKTIFAQKVTDDTERALMLAQLERIGGKDLVPQADTVLRGLRSNRDQVDVLMANGAGLIAKDDAEEAIEDLSRSIDLEPGNAEAYYQRGLAYALLGEKDKAFADYEQTCALNPNHEKAAEKRDELQES